MSDFKIVNLDIYYVEINNFVFNEKVYVYLPVIINVKTGQYDDQKYNFTVMCNIMHDYAIIICIIKFNSN